MNDKVSVGISANPDQVLAAFKKIQDAAKAAGRDMKSMADISFTGLEDAEKTLREFQHGFDQMLSSAVAGRTAQSLRSGVNAGMYGRDPVSWLLNSGRQFPDDRAHQQHVQSVLQQSARLANLPQRPPEGGGGGGGGIGGLAGAVLPMAKSILPLLGVGMGVAFAGKKIGESADEAVAMTDLRRNVRGLDDDFESFRDAVRKSGEGLGVTYAETVKLSQEYARLSGAIGSARTSEGTHEGLLLSRMFGMDAGHGVSMLGRASSLNIGGTSPADQAKLIAEAMVRSNLGGRQAEAAEAMIRFSDNNAKMTGDAGNARGFMEMFAKLTNSGSVGLKDNAGAILSGYDAAVRGGGHAGDAGKAFIYNVLSEMGIRGPFKAQMAMEGGFFGDVGGDKQLGPELIKRIRSMGGGSDMEAARMSGLFGGSMTIAKKVLEKWDSSGAASGSKEAMVKFQKDYEKIQKDLGKENVGDAVRNSGADLQNQLQRLIGDRLLPLITDMKGALGTVAAGVNDIANLLVPSRWQATISPLDGGALPGGKAIIPNRLDPSGRGVVVDSNTPSIMRSQTYADTLSAIERRYGMKSGMLRAIGSVESDLGNNMNHKSNAVGPFALRPGALKDIAKYLGRDINPNDPVDAAEGAAAYYTILGKRRPGFGERKLLTAYHSGDTNVADGKIGPEGAAYANSVYAKMYDPRVAQASASHQTIKIEVAGEVTSLDSARNPVGKSLLKTMSVLYPNGGTIPVPSNGPRIVVAK